MRYFVGQRAAISATFHAIMRGLNGLRRQTGTHKRRSSAILIAMLSVFWAGTATAQQVTGQSVSPTTYSGPGETLTFTITINSGSNTFTSLRVTSNLGITYTCNPASSVNTNTNSTCTGTYLTTGSDSSTLFEIGTVYLTRNTTSGTNTDQLSPGINLQVTKVTAKTDQTITFTDPADIGNATANQQVSLNATATSGLSVSFDVAPASASVCSVSGSTATVLTAGTCTINANQAGNSSYNPAPQVTQSFLISLISDTQAPSLTVPADISVNTDLGQATAVVFYSVTATDNVGVASLAVTPPSGSSFPIGQTTVTVVASDAAGNIAFSSFTVTVTDAEAPQITVPADISVNTNPGQATAVVTYTVTATDNAPGVTVTSSPASGSAFAIGTTTVNATATDAYGNQTSGSFTVTVSDTEAPTITAPSDITVSTDPGNSTAVVTYSVTATDNDGAVTPVLVSGLASGSAFPVGTNAVTWSVTDPSGNSTSGSFNVIVADNEAPVVTVPADISVNTDPGQASAVVTFSASVLDAVDGALTPVITSAPTAGLASGSAFPIGATIVTVSGRDAAGNTASNSFSVTVADNQVPVFTSSQSDINVEIDFNLSSAVVTFPTPTATDNSGSVTVAQTQGLTSGSAFPLGATLVEFTATDGAGLKSTLQFTVTVALIPPGSVSFVVNSPDDGTVTFSSSAPALNTSVVVVGGTGSSGPLQVVPGSYSVGYGLPKGFAVTSASCSSASGAVNLTGQSLTLNFARGESYTCTLQSLDVAEKTEQQIQSFIDNRGRQIMVNRPNQNRRIARVNGDRNLNRLSFFGNSGNQGLTPVGVEVSKDRVNLSFASTSASEDPLMARSDWDVWFEASFTKYETGFGEGRFGILHAGADYRIGQNAILGFGAQVDSVHEDVIGSVATTEGVGWMVGPYYTTRIGEALYLDASLRYGRANNEVSPLGTYTDKFSSERWLASMTLFGSIDRDTLNIRPNVSINYFEETSDPYTDSLAVSIAKSTTSLGDVEMGTRLTWNDPMGQFSNYVEFDGIYTFDASGKTSSASTVEDGVRGRIGLGGNALLERGGALDYGITYDGLGDSDYEAISLSLGYSMKF